MMKKIVDRIFMLYFILFIFLMACDRQNDKNNPPNILFIIADDQTYSGINSNGNDEVITPNLDRLSESGVTFTHAYNMGAWNGAVCVASRAMLNSGRFIWRAKELSDGSYSGFKEQDFMWSQLMASKGYDTYMTGKWHVGVPADSVFMVTGHVRAGMPGTVPEAYNRPLSENDTTWLPWHKKWGGYCEGGKHWSEVVADEAIGFIDSSLTRSNPFFMYIAFNAPHDPRQSPKGFIEMYPLENISLPVSFIEEYPFKDAMGCPATLRDEMLAPFPRTPYSVQIHIQEYYAIITHMDQQIGRIIKHLKASGQDKNTYILFSADHGLGCGKHGLLGKQNMYDHSIRVPLIIVGPDIPENEKRQMQVYLQDLMATTLDIAGIARPEYVDFISLIPLIKDNAADSPYQEIYGAYIDLQRMIRTEEYKLILYPGVPVYRLFDMKNDPHEINDLAADSGYHDLIKQLAVRLKKQQEYMDDTLDLGRYFPELFLN